MHLHKWLFPLLLCCVTVMVALAVAACANAVVDVDLDEQNAGGWVDTTVSADIDASTSMDTATSADINIPASSDVYDNTGTNATDTGTGVNAGTGMNADTSMDAGTNMNAGTSMDAGANSSDSLTAVMTDTLSDPLSGDESADPPEAVYPFGPPNEIGNLMIIMYHGLSENNPPYDRRREDFINDLRYFYANGYRLISVNDLMDKRITVAAGFTPLSLTFDDSKSTAFSLTEVDGELIPKPGCIVDILNNFYLDHPDFGKAATFYINGRDPFAGAGTLAQRFRYLIDNGYDLGNHTWSHADLSKLNATGIQEEIGRIDQLIKENYPDYIPRSLAYPQGKRPRENLRGYALTGEYDGETYAHDWGIREGQSIISANPFHTVFDPTNVPRVRGSDDSTADFVVQDMGYFLRYYANHPEKRYISDGDPDVLTVPEELAHLVNPEALGDVILQCYDADSTNE